MPTTPHAGNARTPTAVGMNAERSGMHVKANTRLAGQQSCNGRQPLEVGGRHGSIAHEPTAPGHAASFALRARRRSDFHFPTEPPFHGQWFVRPHRYNGLTRPRSPQELSWTSSTSVPAALRFCQRIARLAVRAIDVALHSSTARSTAAILTRAARSTIPLGARSHHWTGNPRSAK